MEFILHLSSDGFGQLGRARVVDLVGVDYHPDFFVIAYGDGHVTMFEKEGEYWEMWEGWWREFWERREREER